MRIFGKTLDWMATKSCWLYVLYAIATLMLPVIAIETKSNFRDAWAGLQYLIADLELSYAESKLHDQFDRVVAAKHRLLQKTLDLHA